MDQTPVLDQSPRGGVTKRGSKTSQRRPRGRRGAAAAAAAASVIGPTPVIHFHKFQKNSNEIEIINFSRWEDIRTRRPPACIRPLSLPNGAITIQHPHRQDNRIQVPIQPLSFLIKWVKESVDLDSLIALVILPFRSSAFVCLFFVFCFLFFFVQFSLNLIIYSMLEWYKQQLCVMFYVG